MLRSGREHRADPEYRDILPERPRITLEHPPGISLCSERLISLSIFASRFSRYFLVDRHNNEIIIEHAISTSNFYAGVVSAASHSHIT